MFITPNIIPVIHIKSVITNNIVETINVGNLGTNPVFKYLSLLQPVNINVVSEVDKRYALRGWTATENYGGSYSADVNIEEYLTNVSKYLAIGNVTFYAVFQSESVYDSVTDNKYFTYTYNKGYPVINLNPDTGNNLMGKITLPAKDPDGNYIKGIGLMTGYYRTGDNTTNRFSG